MGDEEPATKADLNHLMVQIEAMMGAIESQKSQLDALISGTPSTTPPTPVETSVKPTLNEDDPDEDGDEGDEDPPKVDDTSRGHSPKVPYPISYVSGRHLQMPHLASCGPPPPLDASSFANWQDNMRSHITLCLLSFGELLSRDLIQLPRT
jgi:hypothetical protein